MEKDKDNQPMEIICVACPKGCRLQAVRDEGGQILVSNAGCKRGQEYAVSEITDPRRMVASTVKVKNALHPLLPVYTSAPFPKGRINELLVELRKVELDAPVKMDQVVIDNVLGTGINIVASRDL
jgi:CxxC motif-containing protein